MNRDTIKDGLEATANALRPMERMDGLRHDVATVATAALAATAGYLKQRGFADAGRAALGTMRRHPVVLGAVVAGGIGLWLFTRYRTAARA